MVLLEAAVAASGGTGDLDPGTIAECVLDTRRDRPAGARHFASRPSMLGGRSDTGHAGRAELGRSRRGREAACFKGPTRRSVRSPDPLQDRSPQAAGQILPNGCVLLRGGWGTVIPALRFVTAIVDRLTFNAQG